MFKPRAFKPAAGTGNARAGTARLPSSASPPQDARDDDDADEPGQADGAKLTMRDRSRTYGGAKALMPWALAWLVSLAAHGLAATVLLRPSAPLPLPEPQPAIIMIELAPEPEAAASEEAAMPPTDTDKADETLDLARLETAEDGAAMKYAPPLPERLGPAEDANVPIPTRRPDPPKQTAARAKPAPKDRDRRAMSEMPETDSPTPMRVQSENGERTAALENTPGLMVDSASLERWQARLMAHLERRKRYPAAARQQRQEGIAEVRFRIDGGGNVLAAELVRSSGYDALDTEATGLVRRASPVPAPPPGVNGIITVPIHFSVR